MCLSFLIVTWFCRLEIQHVQIFPRQVSGVALASKSCLATTTEAVCSVETASDKGDDPSRALVIGDNRCLPVKAWQENICSVN